MSEQSINNTVVRVTYKTGYAINEDGEKMDLPEDVKKKYEAMLKRSMEKIND